MPPHIPPTTLYTTPTRDRFFLIPGGVELPAGALCIRTTDGREQHVEAAALAPYEITREQALPLLREQMRGALGRLFHGLAGGTEPVEEPEAPAIDHVALLRELTGLTPADILHRPDALAQQLRVALTTLRSILAAPGDPTAAEQAHSQLATLEATLQRYGYATDGRITTLTERLRSFARTPAGKRRLARTLEQLDALLARGRST